MNHETSIKTHAAERYVLGQLSPEEWEAFERHYFDCPECGKDICLIAELTENLKAVAKQSATNSRPVFSDQKRDWFFWLRPMLAASSLAVASLAVYQNTVTIPSLRSGVAQSSMTQVLPSVSLTPSTRGTVPSIVPDTKTAFLQLSLEITHKGTFGTYECELRSTAGKIIQRLSVPTLENESLNLLLSRKEFPPASYEAILLGKSDGTATELDRYQFTIRR